MTRPLLIFCLSLALQFSLSPAAAKSDNPPAPHQSPNIILILADDLGYGDLGCYGQTRIKTPNIDRLASQGMRFTQAYSGATVCAPSRCALMTGLHTGHCAIRGNSRQALEPGDATMAEMLKSAGYRTALIGKWGLGDHGTPGAPNKKGFDYFYGFLDQVHAHNYYPDFIYENDARVEIPGNKENARTVYIHDLFMESTLKRLNDWGTRDSASASTPFFLYLAYTLPHANNERGAVTGDGLEVPDPGIYANEPWPPVERNFAAMVTALDASVGAVMKTLDDLGIADNTVLLFTSDNGPHREGGHSDKFFASSGPLRGSKRSLYEGGIRVPAIVRWPGHVKAGAISDFPWAGWDIPATVAQLSGAKSPEGDGLSILPVLKREPVEPHDFFYWEFHEGGFTQAIRAGDWKAIRPHPGQPLELYNLKTDLGEKHNVAPANPEVIAKMESRFTTARTESQSWPIRDDFKPKPTP